jgi:5-methylthioadenosine/S-adenosylhomocysteine deaminase
VGRESVDILIEHGVVVSMDDSQRIIYDGALAIRGSQIVDVGPASEIGRRYVASRRIDASEKAILPGFVNTHHHFLQNLLKGDREDLDFPDWIDAVSAPRISMVINDYQAGRYDLQYHAHRLGCAEALLGGITCILNMEWATHPDLIGVYEEAGIRGVHTLTLTDFDQWGHPGMLLPLEQSFDLAERLIARCAGSRDGLVDFRYGLACANSCTAPLIQEVRRLATGRGVGIHMHIAESEPEWHRMHEQHGTSTIGYLHELGLLGPDVLGAHCIYVSDADIEMMAESGMTVSYCPECHMKLGLGVSPAPAMLRAGIPVSLGTDGSVNDNMDMLEAARCCAFLQRAANRDPRAISAYQALYMATAGGAQALGMWDRLGSLEVSKLADVTLIDLAGCHLRPINHLVNNLVFAAFAEGDVHTVIVNGQIVVEDRRLVTLDARQVLADAEAYAIRRFAEAGLEISPFYRDKWNLQGEQERG